MTSAFTIRSASPCDLTDLARFARYTYLEAFGSDMDEIALQDHLEKRMSDDLFSEMISTDTFFLAHESNTLVGFLQLGIVDPFYQKFLDCFDIGASEIRRLYVLPARQNAGLGSALLRRGIEELVSTGSVYVTTWESNTGAQRLYQRFGFSKIGQIPEYNNKGELNGYEHIMVRLGNVWNTEQEAEKLLSPHS